MTLSSNDEQRGVNVKEHLHGNAVLLSQHQQQQQHARGWDELRARDWERTQQRVLCATFVVFMNIVLTLCDVSDSVVKFAPYYLNLYMTFSLVLISKGYLVPKQLILDDFLKAFVNIVLTLCDAGDSVVMFAPYYFNSSMTFHISGVTDIMVGHDELKTPRSKEEDIGHMQRSRMLARNRQYTYEYFMYDGRKHVCVEGNRKMDGMMPMLGADKSCTKVSRRVFTVPKLRQLSLSC